MAEPTPTEDVYRAAAEVRVKGAFTDVSLPASDEIDRLATSYAQTPGFRAAVDAAYAAGREAGYGQGREDEANGEDLPEWYRLATGEICRPGQPYACGDWHHNGKCVRETTA